MTHARWIVAAAFVAPLVTTAYAQQRQEKDEEEEGHPHETVKMEDLPAAVRATIQREAEGDTVEEVEKETKNGVTVYEAEIISDGKGREIEVSATGTVLERRAAHEEKNEAEHAEPTR